MAESLLNEPLLQISPVFKLLITQHSYIASTLNKRVAFVLPFKPTGQTPATSLLLSQSWIMENDHSDIELPRLPSQPVVRPSTSEFGSLADLHSTDQHQTM